MLNSTYLKKPLSIVLFTISLQIGAAESFSIQDLSYKGATRFLDVVSGESRLGFANGTFVVDTEKGSVFLVGHNQDQALAEYKLNGFSKSTNIDDLPFSKPSLQVFSKILDRATNGNPQGINTITGLALVNGDLLVNAAKYYDGNSSNTDTTLVIDNPNDIKNSGISGYFTLESRNHAAGWMTPIPHSQRESLGGDYIFGFASNLPINGRNSMGPSAFSVDINSIQSLKPNDIINTKTLLDFSIDHQLHEDHYNKNGDNNLWTELSMAYVGFIVPGTETYAVFGTSGGHESGIGYKITQDDGTLCGGACSKSSSDRYNYYWLWDVKDLKAVKEGRIYPHEVQPYEYGKFDLPFSDENGVSLPNIIIGAHYDFENQDLYFMLGEADKMQSQFESLPLLLVFDINSGLKPNPPLNLKIN
jgi:hypothetical protein